jgi:hypothetical protein
MDNCKDITKEEAEQLNEVELESIAGGFKGSEKTLGPTSPIVTIHIPTH